MGRSDIFLKLELIKKTLGITALIIAVWFFDSPVTIAMTGVITGVISTVINAYPNEKLINYSYFEQIKDILPSFLVAIVMLGVVLCVELLKLGPMLTLVVQITTGIVVYIVLSALFHLEPFRMMIHALKKIISSGC